MRRRAALLTLAAALGLGGCATRQGPVAGGHAPHDGTGEGAIAPQGRELGRGLASWYGDRHHGRRTASGEVFDMHALTAAHRTLAFGTRVRVINPANGRSVVVRINDRGPFTGGRVIDLSRAAAERLGMLRAGVAPVVLQAE